MQEFDAETSMVIEILKSLGVVYRIDEIVLKSTGIIHLDIIKKDIKSMSISNQGIQVNLRLQDRIVIPHPPIQDLDEETFEIYYLIIKDLLENSHHFKDNRKFFQVPEDFFKLVLSILNDIGFYTTETEWSSVRDMLPAGIDLSNSFYINTEKHVISLEWSGLKVRKLSNFDHWFIIPIPMLANNYEPSKKVLSYFFKHCGLLNSSSTNLTQD